MNTKSISNKSDKKEWKCGSMAETDGECKQGMGRSWDGKRGYQTLCASDRDGGGVSRFEDFVPPSACRPTLARRERNQSFSKRRYLRDGVRVMAEGKVNERVEEDTHSLILRSAATTRR